MIRLLHTKGAVLMAFVFLAGYSATCFARSDHSKPFTGRQGRFGSRNASFEKKNDEAKTIDDLVKTIRFNPDQAVRWRALELLVNFGDRAKSELPAIADMITGELKTARFGGDAASAARFSTFRGSGLWVLEEWMADSGVGQDLRLWAIRSLELMGSNGLEMPPEAKHAVPVLVKVISDKDEVLQTRAMSVLGKMATNAKEALPALVGSLEKSKGVTAVHAAAAVCQIEHDNRRAIEYLKVQVKSQDPQLARLAIRVISRLPPRKEFILLLLEQLRSNNSAVRAEVVWALNSCSGPFARDVLPRVKKSLSDENLKVREAAKFALAALEQEINEADEQGRFLPAPPP
jgi:HEAT repeat protein